MTMYYVYINGKRSAKRYTYDEALSLVEYINKTFVGLDVRLVEE